MSVIFFIPHGVHLFLGDKKKVGYFFLTLFSGFYALFSDNALLHLIE
ncbi:hypothetical protein RICGR_0904 [Rickettsiella grylli]|uniref:Uncharacterized protein n=1 Tax=Rickettsiella grylli TaxID=59196 RepID=A8PN51_9COXI|nr:hypothetical protein RICGR_0904 [Rickettsiella grylli]